MGNKMKHLILTLMLLASMAAATAYARNCSTICYNGVCQTICN